MVTKTFPYVSDDCGPSEKSPDSGQTSQDLIKCTHSTSEIVNEPSDVCPYCEVVRYTDGYNGKFASSLINNSDRMQFLYKSKNRLKGRKKNAYVPITKCQLQRHNNTESGVWLLCGNSVYDATNYIEYHPGGMKSIIRKSGGVVDCTRDMSFHSSGAVKLWKEMKIGYLAPCPSEKISHREPSYQGEQCVIC